MKKSFNKRMLAGICAIAALNAMSAFPANAETTEAELTVSAPSELSEETLYASILSSFKIRLDNGFANYQDESSTRYGVLLDNPQEFSYLWYRYGGQNDNAGYAITDLDGDGRKELVIGTIDEDNNGTIYDLYTNYEGNVYHIAAAGERDHFTLTNRGTIIEEGSSGADSHSTIFYNIGRNRLEVDSAYAVEGDKIYKADSYADNEEGTGYAFTWAETEEAVPTNYACQSIKFTPFSEYSNIDTEETDKFLQEYFDSVARAFGFYAKQEYEAKNGTAPANASCEFSDDNANAIITLTDENDNVLDVYTVSVETGIGTNKNGKEVDLSVYAEEPEYFMSFDYIGTVARIYYYQQTGTEPTGSGTSYDIVDNTVQINVYDNTYTNALETYTINAETGIGTDSKGNAVDFSVYADYKPLEESDFFMSTIAIMDTARDYYKETTGTDAEGRASITEKPSFNHEVEITLCSEDETVLEVYTIVAETGIGTDGKGNAVNLAEYATEKQMEKIYASVAKSFNFYAKQEYEAKDGTAPANASCEFSDDKANAVITLTNEKNNVLDVYTVDVSTGIGTNQNGDAVDLFAYAKEPNYFMPYDYIGDVAEIYYFEQIGTRAGSKGMLTDMVDKTIEITIYDDDNGTAEIYTINAETGIGTDRFGGEVDFSVYADYKPLEDSDYFIPQDTIFDVARAYFKERTGAEPEGGMGMAEKPSFRHELEITFCAEDGTVLEVYTIFAETGTGTDSNGNAIDLAEFAKNLDNQETEPTSETDTSYFATPEEIADMAVKDYEKKTGTASHWADILVDDDTNTVAVILADSEDNTIETYMIDRVTGKGETSTGEEVNLPQTGNNSMTNLLTVMGTFLMIGFGTITIKLSGILHRKEEQ